MVIIGSRCLLTIDGHDDRVEWLPREQCPIEAILRIVDRGLTPEDIPIVRVLGVSHDLDNYLAHHQFVLLEPVSDPPRDCLARDKPKDCLPIEHRHLRIPAVAHGASNLRDSVGRLTNVDLVVFGAQPRGSRELFVDVFEAFDNQHVRLSEGKPGVVVDDRVPQLSIFPEIDFERLDPSAVPDRGRKCASEAWAG